MREAREEEVEDHHLAPEATFHKEEQTQEPELEKRGGEATLSVPEVRTPVKVRVKNINKKAEGSPRKYPGWKQAKLSHYFGKTSPKAM